jgi:hypothetical protein
MKRGQRLLPSRLQACDSGWVGTVTRPDKWHDRPASGAPGTGRGRWPALRPDTWIMVASIGAPIVTAAVLIPWRHRLDTADNALFLVVVIVAVASTGRRAAAALSALVSALAFDFFLTRPYYSFRITRDQDLITEILLLVVGLAVGELAARGRRHRDAAWQGQHQVALLHSVTELAATGKEPELVVASAARELRELLELRECRFTSRDPGGTTARVTPNGDVTVGNEIWSTDDIGLPTHNVDLPVRSGGWLLGHFLLTPTPGRPVSHERLLVAVTIADQVGAALAADDSGNAGPGGTGGAGGPVGPGTHQLADPGR